MSKGSSSDVSTPSPEDYMPLVQQQADINRIDQSTPFGSTNYSYENTPLSEQDWLAGGGGGRGDFDGGMVDHVLSSTYENYLSNFDRGRQSVSTGFSPELQSLFNQQFDPNAYQQYGDDYMADARRYLDPIYDRQDDRFQQRMANRGQPEGGELYNDMYQQKQLAQNTGWENAAFGATQAGNTARLEDFNRLMAAMGMSQVSYPNIDVMGPANLAMNADIANQQASNQSSSNLWNTAADLGSSYFLAR